MLINSAKSKDVALKCLSNNEAETEFYEYFKNLASDSQNIDKRKRQIKEYVEKHFFDVPVQNIMTEIKTEIQKILDESSFKKISKAISLPIFIDYVNPECVKSANYDLMLGGDVYVTSEKVPTKLNTMGKNGVVSIEPGEFGILMTHEFIFVPPDLMGFISVRLTHKQKGLVNISGFHVDPGFYGRLMFAVFNAGPNDVPLRYKEPVFMMMLNQLTDPSPVKRGKWYGMENIPVETLSGLRGTSVSVRNLDERLKRLEMLFPIIVTGVAGIVIAVITWLLTHW